MSRDEAPIEHALPATRSVLAICAHPDDESFGLGAVLSAFVDAGARVSLLCFTRGEASTLRAAPGDLADVRARELAAATAVLGVAPTELLNYPDGSLANQPLDALVDHVRRLAHDVSADTFLVFDEGGITGHPDHRRATEAAMVAARADDRTVIAWVLRDDVAHALNEELATSFVGRPPQDIDIAIPVDRSRQLAAMAQHPSQLLATRVPGRRLTLTGDTEYLRYLHRTER